MYFSFHLISKFPNLKWLTIAWGLETLNTEFQKFPDLEVLQLCMFSDYYRCHDLGRYLSSTGVPNKPSTISFNFFAEADRDKFHYRVIQFVDVRLWRINLNADGPKRFTNSIAFI